MIKSNTILTVVCLHHWIWTIMTKWGSFIKLKLVHNIYIYIYIYIYLYIYSKNLKILVKIWVERFVSGSNAYLSKPSSFALVGIYSSDYRSDSVMGGGGASKRWGGGLKSTGDRGSSLPWGECTKVRVRSHKAKRHFTPLPHDCFKAIKLTNAQAL